MADPHGGQIFDGPGSRVFLEHAAEIGRRQGKCGGDIIDIDVGGVVFLDVFLNIRGHSGGVGLAGGVAEGGVLHELLHEKLQVGEEIPVALGVGDVFVDLQIKIHRGLLRKTVFKQLF